MSEKNQYVGLEALIRIIAHIKAGFATLGHKHPLEDIEDYVVDNDLSSTSTNPVQNKVITAKVTEMGNTLNSHTNLIANKADSSALNNYYTKTEVDNLELITVDEIDTICGNSIKIASADGVEF